jgi:hypothetical protein
MSSGENDDRLCNMHCDTYSDNHVISYVSYSWSDGFVSFLEKFGFVSFINPSLKSFLKKCSRAYSFEIFPILLFHNFTILLIEYQFLFLISFSILFNFFFSIMLLCHKSYTSWTFRSFFHNKTLKNAYSNNPIY